MAKKSTAQHSYDLRKIPVFNRGVQDTLKENRKNFSQFYYSSYVIHSNQLSALKNIKHSDKSSAIPLLFCPWADTTFDTSKFCPDNVATWSGEPVTLRAGNPTHHPTEGARGKGRLKGIRTCTIQGKC